MKYSCGGVTFVFQRNVGLLSLLLYKSYKLIFQKLFFEFSLEGGLHFFNLKLN